MAGLRGDVRDLVPSVHDREVEPLDRDSLEVYRHLIGTASSTAVEISESTGLHLDRVTHSISALRALHLANPASGVDERVIAVSPEAAKYQFIGPMIREIHRMESRVDDAHELFREAINTYESCTRNEAPGRSIEALSDRLSVLRVIEELSASATMEVLISYPGGARPREVLAESAPRTEALLKRGVAMRTIYQHTARFDQETAAYVENITRLGAEVRTRGDGFMCLLMFDRKAAIIKMEDDAEGATLVLDPSVVSFMFHAFERAWSRGTAFDGKYRRLDIENISKDVRQTIISLMIDGIEDKVIARRLGMSLRTCQRHISEIMQQLGAKNRLHAGYLINALGLPRTGSSLGSLTPGHRELSSPPVFDRPERPDGSSLFQSS